MKIKRFIKYNIFSIVGSVIKNGLNMFGMILATASPFLLALMTIHYFGFIAGFITFFLIVGILMKMLEN